MKLETVRAADADVVRLETDRATTLNGDLLQEAWEIVNGMPAKQRFALVLRKYQRLEYAEIAASLEISEETAKQSVYQAYRRLREQVADQLMNH
jgi:RNA polymerase sigma factor (sigma-70 family)